MEGNKILTVNHPISGEKLGETFVSSRASG